MSKFVVTGEAGSLASHLIPALENQGHEQVKVKGSKVLVTPYSKVKEVDVTRDFDLWPNPNIVFHLAGLVSTPRCNEYPELTFRSNVESCYKLALRHIPGQLFVYFGTTVMHDVNAPRPFTEDSPIKALTTYGLTKWLGEEVLRQLIPTEDLLIVRPCFVYGGRFDHASVITQMIRAKLSGSKETLNIPLDPKNMKDYLYIDDFIGGLLKLVEHRITGTFNIVKGTPEPFENVIGALEELDLLPKIRLFPELDYLGHHIVDGSRAKQVISFNPRNGLLNGMTAIKTEIILEGD